MSEADPLQERMDKIETRPRTMQRITATLHRDPDGACRLDEALDTAAHVITVERDRNANRDIVGSTMGTPASVQVVDNQLVLDPEVVWEVHDIHCRPRFLGPVAAAGAKVLPWCQLRVHEACWAFPALIPMHLLFDPGAPVRTPRLTFGACSRVTLALELAPPHTMDFPVAVEVDLWTMIARIGQRVE